MELRFNSKPTCRVRKTRVCTSVKYMWDLKRLMHRERFVERTGV